MSSLFKGMCRVYTDLCSRILKGVGQEGETSFVLNPTHSFEEATNTLKFPQKLPAEEF
nr:MAG TPA: hypothetical protein [Caudoviricetes sp.]